MTHQEPRASQLNDEPTMKTERIMTVDHKQVIRRAVHIANVIPDICKGVTNVWRAIRMQLEESV